MKSSSINQSFNPLSIYPYTKSKQSKFRKSDSNIIIKVSTNLNAKLILSLSNNVLGSPYYIKKRNKYKSSPSYNNKRIASSVNPF